MRSLCELGGTVASSASSSTVIHSRERDGRDDIKPCSQVGELQPKDADAKVICAHEIARAVLPLLPARWPGGLMSAHESVRDFQALIL